MRTSPAHSHSAWSRRGRAAAAAFRRRPPPGSRGPVGDDEDHRRNCSAPPAWTSTKMWNLAPCHGPHFSKEMSNLEEATVFISQSVSDAARDRDGRWPVSPPRAPKPVDDGTDAQAEERRPAIDDAGSGGCPLRPAHGRRRPGHGQVGRGRRAPDRGRGSSMGARSSGCRLVRPGMGPRCRHWDCRRAAPPGPHATVMRRDMSTPREGAASDFDPLGRHQGEPQSSLRDERWRWKAWTRRHAGRRRRRGGPRAPHHDPHVRGSGRKGVSADPVA